VGPRGGMQKNDKNALTETKKNKSFITVRESGTEHAQNTSTLAGSPSQKE